MTSQVWALTRSHGHSDRRPGSGHPRPRSPEGVDSGSRLLGTRVPTETCPLSAAYDFSALRPTETKPRATGLPPGLKGAHAL